MIPEEIRHLGQLKQFWIVQNLVEKLPRSLAKLRKLELLYLECNPLPPNWQVCLFGYEKTQDFLQNAVEAYYNDDIASVVFMLCYKKKVDALLRQLPREIVKIICQYIRTTNYKEFSDETHPLFTVPEEAEFEVENSSQYSHFL